MKKLIIHIGYMKTATTSLQINFFSSLMKRNKIEYLNHTNKNNLDSFGPFRVNNIVSFILGNTTHKEFQHELLNLSNIKQDTTLLSNENISCFSEKYPSTSCLAEATCNAKKIHEIFSPYFDKIEIILAIREQRSMLVSFYTQIYSTLIKYRPAWQNINVWIKDNFKYYPNKKSQFLDYHAMYMAYTKYFGKKNVHILMYEDLLHDKDRFYTKLSQIFIVNTSEVKELFESSIQNKTKKLQQDFVVTEKGDLSVKLFAIAHKIFRNNDSKLFGITKIIFKFIVPSALLKTKVGTRVKIRKLTDEECTFIQDLFNKSNERLTADAGLDKKKMIRYGYIKG